MKPSKRQSFVISRTALKLVILPMAVFGYQRFLVGDVASAAGAATIVAATVAYELRYDLRHIPFDESDLKDAAERIGDVEEDIVESVEERRES